MKKRSNFSYSKLVIQMGKILFASAMVFQLLFVTGCKHDDLSVALPNENIRPAGDFVKNNYEMRLFYAAIKKTGYIEQLNGAGPFTVFAPTDEAFNRLGVYSATDFDKMNVDSLKKIIGYHILPRKLLVNDIPSNGIDVRYATLTGPELYVSRAAFNPNGGVENELYIDGVEAIRKDVVVSNGVLHLMDNVMKPNFNRTVQQWLATHADYSVFVKGLKKFNLWDQLATGTTFTIFAPNNQALEEVGITEAFLNSLETDKYIGDRLFGAYILYDRHFFISDSQVFSLINFNGAYNYFLKNDSHYMNFGGGKLYPEFKLGYNLTLRSGNTVSDVILNAVTSNLTAKNDNLCSNGIVHHLVSGLVTPNQATKK
ncbi:fasciclin domain-containing protein [Pedobacter sp. 22163]|uniref:fasciclin domain-containing protein n=1 Tax=Pedobacter sp. 22163 TaxID=3453883 RepID=UPI003F859DF4